MRRLPGPASGPLGDGVKTPEAPVGLFRGWQRTQTQSSVRTLRSLRQQMDVWFCLMQESSAERHCCVEADPDQTNCAPSGARPGILCFSLDFDLHRGGPTGHYPFSSSLRISIPNSDERSSSLSSMWARSCPLYSCDTVDQEIGEPSRGRIIPCLPIAFASVDDHLKMLAPSV